MGNADPLGRHGVNATTEWGQEQHDHRAQAESLEYFVGVDLGQANDYTAISVVHRLRTLTGPPEEGGKMQTTYDLHYLNRVPLGTRYPAIIRGVQHLLSGAPLSEDSPLVVDRTGVGVAVVDMFREAGLRPQAITIHGGDTVAREHSHHRVPKRDLAGTLVSLYQSQRLRVARGEELVDVLTEELLNFKPRINIATGHDSYEAWRESIHDDLVLSVAMACWFAENQPRGVWEETDPDADARPWLD